MSSGVHGEPGGVAVQDRGGDCAELQCCSDFVPPVPDSGRHCRHGEWRTAQDLFSAIGHKGWCRQVIREIVSKGNDNNINLITHTVPWFTGAICDRYLLFLPRTKINIALAEPEGRYVHARMLPLFRQPFFSLALYHCAAKFFFAFLAIWSSFVVRPLAHAYIFILGESLLEAFGRQSESEKDFVTSWRVSIPLSFHPLFRLWPTFRFSPCSIAFFCSSPFCISFTLALFSSLLHSVCACSGK